MVYLSHEVLGCWCLKLQPVVIRSPAETIFLTGKFILDYVVNDSGLSISDPGLTHSLKTAMQYSELPSLQPHHLDFNSFFSKPQKGSWEMPQLPANRPGLLCWVCKESGSWNCYWWGSSARLSPGTTYEMSAIQEHWEEAMHSIICHVWLSQSSSGQTLTQ